MRKAPPPSQEAGPGGDASRPVSRVLSPPPVRPPRGPPPAVGDGHPSGAPVARRLERPHPGLGRAAPGAPRRSAPVRPCSGRGLPGRPVTRPPVGSYPTISPLPRRACAHRGCVLSVALSFGSPRLGVTQRPALRSPDFPRAVEPPAAVRPACDGESTARLGGGMLPPSSRGHRCAMPATTPSPASPAALGFARVSARTITRTYVRVDGWGMRC